MSTVIRIIELATGEEVPFGGQFIKSFDPQFNHDGFGCGALVATPKAGDALHFRSIADAWEFWKQQSPTVPVRPDGKPNRPLTAFTVSMETFSEEEK